MERLRIALAPELEPWRPEVTWTWRTLLETAGWSWVETPYGAPCDICHGGEPAAAQAALFVRADGARWACAPTVAGVTQVGDLVLPVYAGASQAEPGGLRDVAGVAGASTALGALRDLAFDFFWMSTGGAEANVPFDTHGTLHLESSEAPQRSLWYEAAASTIVAWLEACGAALGWPPPLARWPGGHRAAAAVGHDVDYPEIIRWLEPARVLARQGVAGTNAAWEVATGRRTHWHFADWMEIEEEYGGRSAFYFVPRKGSLLEYARGMPDPFYDVQQPQFSALFAELDRRGFEIGLHASYLALESAERLGAERQLLSQAAGVDVLGNRHHYWHLQPGAPDDTLLLHPQAGLLYDTSMTNDRYLGWRRGLCTPYKPFHRAERTTIATLQIGTAWMDDHIFGAAELNPGAPDLLLRGLAERADRLQGCLLIDVHDYVYDERLFPGWRNAYHLLWQALREMGGFWLATPLEVARHWLGRSAALTAASNGLDAEGSARA